jgi:hypothetical protein
MGVKNMNKKIFIGTILAVFMLVAISYASAFSTQTTETVITDTDKSIDPEIERYASALLDSPYNIDIYTMTMREVKELVYTELSEVDSLDKETLSKVEQTFETLESIGVTPDMTIAQSKEVIKENEKILKQQQEGGLNLLCTMSIFARGNILPIYRFPVCHFGMWNIYDCWSVDRTFIHGLLGMQWPGNWPGTGGFAGFVIQFRGLWFKSKAVTPWGDLEMVVDIEGFATISLSDMPFL